MSELSRRDMLRLAGASCAACVLPACGWPVNPAPTIDAGAVDANGQVTISTANLQRLASEGDALRATASGWSGSFLIVRHAGAFVVTDGDCTHLGCPLGYDDEHDLIACPCHGSTFGLDGSVRHPPAVVGLNLYPNHLDGSGALIIETPPPTST